MIRLFFYVALLALAVFASVWLADHPGSVAIDWLGWRIETSMPVVLVALAVLSFLLSQVYRLISALWRLPKRWLAKRRESRRRKGYQALTDGLAAAATGNAKQVHRLAGKARKLLNDPALTAYLSAQAAQLTGDAKTAADHYTAMLDRPETTALGLRGLLNHAVQNGDDARALELATQARALNPADEWLADLLFSLLIKTGRLREAHELLADAVRHHALSGPDAAQRRAHLATERSSRALRDGDIRAAIDFAKQAIGADPSFAPAAVSMAEAQMAANKPRRAAAALEKIWSQHPAESIALAYEHLAPGEDPLQRVRRLEKLIATNPSHPLSHTVIAEAALRARLWGQARNHLNQVVENNPTARVFRLLAQLEQGEFKDQAAAQRWLNRAIDATAEPTWTCTRCGHSTAEWSLTCPSCATPAAMTLQTPSAKPTQISA